MLMGGPGENLATARQSIKAIETGARGDEVAQFFAPQAIVEIFPSKFFPPGSRDDLAGIRATADCGKKAVSRQRYEIKNELARGDYVALEIAWTGTLASAVSVQPLSRRNARALPPSCNSRTARSSFNATRLLRP
jgi:hypothetical protein